MSKARKPAASKAAGLTFESLVLSISDVDHDLGIQAGRAVNISLTLRNWLIGLYIAEYEMRGADRAAVRRKTPHESIGPPGRGRRQPGRGA